MKLLLALLQILMLALGFAANRADAMAGAAVFSVLCLVVVFICEPRRVTKAARGWK